MIKISTLGSRIEKLIEMVGCKKTEFAERIGITPAYVSQICSGVRKPSDRVIKDICREYNVNKEWLLKENGQPFRQMSKQDEISAFMGDLLKSNPDFRHRLILVLSRMQPEEWDLLEKKINELYDEMKNADP